MLAGIIDQFGGIIVDRFDLVDPVTFSETLIVSLHDWIEKKINSVWITINPTSQTSLIEVLIRNKFQFHHADEKEATLTRWLRTDIESTLPHYCTHFIGAGGLVFHPTDPQRVLAISERVDGPNGKLKLPGGLVDDKESVIDAAKREVFEETGIECDTRGASLMLIRDLPNSRFGKSDIYFVVRLTALTTIIKADPKEIYFCDWFNLETILSTPEKLYPLAKAVWTTAFTQNPHLYHADNIKFGSKEAIVFGPTTSWQAKK